MFGSIVSIRRLSTTIPCRNILTVITGDMLASSCFSRKVSVSYTKRGGSSAATSVGVNLRLLLQSTAAAAE